MYRERDAPNSTRSEAPVPGTSSGPRPTYLFTRLFICIFYPILTKLANISKSFSEFHEPLYQTLIKPEAVVIGTSDL